MTLVDGIFERIHKLIYEDVEPDVLSVLIGSQNQEVQTLHESEISVRNSEKKLPTFTFLFKIFEEIDTLRNVLENDETILISVSNQKLLRTCFQLTVSLGLSQCLIPGLGLSLSKRCTSGSLLPPTVLTDEQKYEMLLTCTDFFTRCYSVPVLKNIIITLHLSDYLAALIQLSFAPLKKPGTYPNYTMTQQMYDKYQLDHEKYAEVYKSLVTICFQPTVMKELLVLQSVTDPSPPAFVKRVIQKEMSCRLLAPGGLLSLIRCFIENSAVDTGLEWKKIDMICRIVSAQHGTDSLQMYLTNICSQLTQILTINNTHYLATAIACALSLNVKYPQSQVVSTVITGIFQALDYSKLLQSSLPGTVILSPQEVSHHINVLHACVSCNTECPVDLLTPSLHTLCLLGMKCKKNKEMSTKIIETLLKCLEKLDKEIILKLMKDFLFGEGVLATENVLVEEYDAGLAIKFQTAHTEYPKSEAVSFLFDLFMKATEIELITNMFEASLMILIEFSEKKNCISKTEDIITEDDNELVLNNIDENYAIILQFLSEISETPKVLHTLKLKPSIILHFVEYFLTKKHDQQNECVTIALVLLNTILSNSKKIEESETRLYNLIPVLKNIAQNESNMNSILCTEALSLISNEMPRKVETRCDKAISEVFNHLLPVRAHGIIELRKLIEEKDPETLSKKHYLFCLFQEQLKDPDSYVYLAAINGIAALGTHCTEDVLQILCKEFLQDSTDCHGVLSNEREKQKSELRLKIGDIIVRVTRSLGEMAIVHKTILLNTMLCGCRDADPFIRTSALSNLAEIALVLHYKVGSIIYEVLLCIWSILETDKAVECRRAAVMVITSLLKGLGKETLIQLKENLLPIYRTLKKLHRDENEDDMVRLHAQLALEELNHTVTELLFPELKMEKQIFVLDKQEDVLQIKSSK